MDSGNALWLERRGTRSFVAKNDRGLEINVGHGPEDFSPGDLLKIALAGCQAMSSDARFAKALGTDDFRLTAGIDGKYLEDEDRYESFLVELVTDMSRLDEEARTDLERRAQSAISRHCTIEHTLSKPVTVETQITDECNE